MKFSCSREELAKNLTIAQRATDARSNVQVLRNVLFDLEDNRLNLVGYDHRIGIRTSMACTVEEAGSVTVPCALVLEVLGVMGDETVFFNLDGNTLALECGKSAYKFECIESDDFPPFPQMSSGKEFSMDAAVLERGIKRTLFATNPDDPRAFMGGVYFGVENGGLALVSTDGHRLTWFHVPGQAAPLGDKGVIVPARTLTELLRILPAPAKPEKGDKAEEGAAEAKAASGAVIITVQDDAISFAADGIYMISRLVKADYPNYEKVIPSEKLGECRVARGRLANAVRGAAIMARAKENQYIIEFSVADNVLQLSSSTQDVGSAREEVDIEQKGSKISVSFNSRYVLDFLNAVPEDEVVFQYSEPLKATLFHTDNPDYKYVLMPIKM